MMPPLVVVKQVSRRCLAAAAQCSKQSVAPRTCYLHLGGGRGGWGAACPRPQEEGKLIVEREQPTKQANAFHGLARCAPILPPALRQQGCTPGGTPAGHRPPGSPRRLRARSIAPHRAACGPPRRAARSRRPTHARPRRPLRTGPWPPTW